MSSEAIGSSGIGGMAASSVLHNRNQFRESRPKLMKLGWFIQNAVHVFGNVLILHQALPPASEKDDRRFLAGGLHGIGDFAAIDIRHAQIGNYGGEALFTLHRRLQ